MMVLMKTIAVIITNLDKRFQFLIAPLNFVAVEFIIIKKMSREVISWIAIVAILVVVLLERTVSELCQKKHSNMFEVGNEDEMFWCPGDPKQVNDGRR